MLSDYNNLFTEQLNTQCCVYMLIGNGGNENPMWLQFAELIESGLHFRSSQNSAIWFTIPFLNNDNIDTWCLDFPEIYNHFRTLKYDYIQSNFPTVYSQVK